MTAEQLARALGGRRLGGGWMARCPGHNDEDPSLSIRDKNGTLLVHCHAGCDQAQIISALRSRGLWEHGANRRSASGCQFKSRENLDEADRRKFALALWAAAAPAANSPVETYLASRGLKLPPARALRFHPSLKHPQGGTWPAMIGLVTSGFDDRPLGIHPTFLARDGNGKAPVQPQKMMLGPCRGGAVRLGPVENALMVGEGIESCLAAMRAAGRTAWAALSTSGLRSLDLPDGIREVVVIADGDDAGESAAHAAASRWAKAGRDIRIARPPRGFDFNDMLTMSSRKRSW